MDEKDKRIQELQRQIAVMKVQSESLRFSLRLMLQKMNQIKRICTEETEEKEESR